MARDVYGWWAKGRPAEQLRAEVQALARASDEEARASGGRGRRRRGEVSARVAAVVSRSLLAQVPAAVRQTQRRLADPTGRTVAASLSFREPGRRPGPAAARRPRFQKGQRPRLRRLGARRAARRGRLRRGVESDQPAPSARRAEVLPRSRHGRFLRNEADLLGRVVSQGKHPGIVALLDTALESDPPCLKYEYVSGGDLTGLIRQWHQDRKDDVTEQSLRVMHELAGIVAFAHRLAPPIVHRDLKPANILLAVASDQW